MTTKQYNWSKKLLESSKKNQWINEQDFADILYLIERLWISNNFDTEYYDNLETLPREKAYQILTSVGIAI